MRLGSRATRTTSDWTNDSPAKLICLRPESHRRSFNGAQDELQVTRPAWAKTYSTPLARLRDKQTEKYRHHRDVDSSKTEGPLRDIALTMRQLLAKLGLCHIFRSMGNRLLKVNYSRSDLQNRRRSSKISLIDNTYDFMLVFIVTMSLSCIFFFKILPRLFITTGLCTWP